MSRVYIHSKKYSRRSRRRIALVCLVVLLLAAVAGMKLYSRYNQLNQTPETQVSDSQQTLIGYINPYFLFKDTAKWVQDKGDSTASKVIYNEYIGGQAVRQLVVYINQTPTPTQLAAARVLPVQVVNGGDSLSAGSLSKPCASSLPAGQQAVKQVSFDGTTMLCDPNPNAYSVVLAEQGGDYELKMTVSKVPRTYVVVYTDFSSQPNANTIINIANSFKAV